MKTLLFLLITSTCATAQYSYSIYNPANSLFAQGDFGNWQQNAGDAALTLTSAGVASSGSAGGSLIYTSTAATDYEVSMSINLNSASLGGYFVQYVRASSNALANPGGHYDAGTYAAIVLASPAIATDGSCSMQFGFFERTNTGTHEPYQGTVACEPTMTIRTVVFGTSVWSMINGQVYTFSTSLASGYPGVGMASALPGNGIAKVQVGPRCMTIPNPIALSTVTNSTFANNVSLHWTEPGEPASLAGIPIAFHSINRSGANYWFDVGTDFTDANVGPDATISYSILESTFHGVQSPPTNFSVQTLAANYIDPRHTGLKPNGTYWGGAGEQIDAVSGNLNFTNPLITAQGRGGWSVPFVVSYNSQQWRQDKAGVWNMGQDVGYGFGWRFSAGSLTPYWNQGFWAIDHYLYIDSSGSEYRLYQQTSGSKIWTSRVNTPGSTPSSGESIYVYFDSNAGILHFHNGSFWVMGCTSGGLEQDAGTLYPTIMEDRNGNQVLVRYMTGTGANYPNSSARIQEIEDTRAVANGSSARRSYSFAYLPPDASNIPHLQGITSYIGTGENYSFSYYTTTLHDPFNAGQAYPNIDLFIASWNGVPLGYSFSYDPSGELTNAYLPYGGYLRWAYQTNTYTWPSGTVKQNAVSGRYLAIANSATMNQITNHQSVCTSAGQTNCIVEAPFQFAYTLQTAMPNIGQTCLTDAPDMSGNQPYRCWVFHSDATNTATTWWNGLLTELTRKSSSSATTTLQHDLFTWTQDPTTLNPYISTDRTIIDEAASSQVYKQTSQAADQYGNITLSQQWDFTTSVPTGAPTRTYTNTYQTISASGVFPFSVLQQSILTDVANNSVTLVSNSYDVYGSGGTAQMSGVAANCQNNLVVCEADTMYTTYFNARGNVVTAIYPGSKVNTSYDQTGTPVAANDGNGHAVAISSQSSTNYSAPSQITPNTGNATADANLATSLQYAPSLVPQQATGPDNSIVKQTYDGYGRSLSSTSATGAVTAYTYTFGSSSTNGGVIVGPYTSTTQTNSHFASSIWDGLGRPGNQSLGWLNGATANTVTLVDIAYAPCACTPLGKMYRQSQPYAPNSTEYWTTYSYDGLGRTLSVIGPDGLSATTYKYQGNWTSVVDPAGNWKQYLSDAFGNTVAVVEPDPNAGAVLTAPPSPPSLTATGTLVTSYTYDFLNHLTKVSMPRGTVTQTRTFTYNALQQLTNTVNPETGQVIYTYNADGTLNTRKVSERRHPLHFRPVTSFTLFELPGRGGGVKREGHETAAPPLTPALNGAQVASLRSLIFRPAEPA